MQLKRRGAPVRPPSAYHRAHWFLLAGWCLCVATLHGADGGPRLRTGRAPLRDAPTLAGIIGPGSSGERITLVRAIELALQNNLDVQLERVGIDVERARVRFEVGAFDPTVSISASRDNTERLENAGDVRSSDIIQRQAAIQSQNDFVDAVRLTQGLPPITREDATTSSFGRDQSIAFSSNTQRNQGSLIGRTPWGLRYGFEFSTNRARTTFTGDNRDIVPEFTTVAQLTVVQPLLRNLGPAANLADLRVARVNREIQTLTWKNTVASAVQGVMSNYFDMLGALETVRVREDAIGDGEKLVAIFRRRLELGFGTPLDVSQSEAEVSDAREALVVARSTFLERQFALKRLIARSYDSDDARIFVPVPVAPLGVPQATRTSLLQTAFEKRYEYQAALLEAESQDIRVRFARNQVLPQLDLVASYGFNGLDTSYARSIESAFSGEFPTFSLGFNFELPLLNLRARAQLAATRGRKEQALLGIKRAEVAIGVDVDTVLARIETARQSVETATQTRQVREEAVRVAYRRLEEGQIAASDVLEQQRLLTNAKARELQNLAERNKAIALLWTATGTILERNGIGFSEPGPRRR